jgi:hypothetical protein
MCKYDAAVAYLGSQCFVLVLPINAAVAAAAALLAYTKAT